MSCKVSGFPTPPTSSKMKLFYKVYELYGFHGGNQGWSSSGRVLAQHKWRPGFHGGKCLQSHHLGRRGQKYEFVLSYIEFQASVGYLSLKSKVGECETDVLLNVNSDVENTKMKT